MLITENTVTNMVTSATVARDIDRKVLAPLNYALC